MSYNNDYYIYALRGTGLYYFFSKIYGELGDSIALKFDSNFTQSQINAVKQIADNVQNIANINFVYNTSVGGDVKSEITFSNADLPPGVAGWASSESAINDIFAIRYRDVEISNDFLSESFVPGTFEYKLLLHEIGHALGLKHPGNYEGDDSTRVPYLPIEEDSQNASVMSYNNSSWTKVGGPAATRAGDSIPQTYQIYDIAAL